MKPVLPALHIQKNPRAHLPFGEDGDQDVWVKGDKPALAGRGKDGETERPRR